MKENITPAITAEGIYRLLNQAFSPSTLEVIDDGEQHINHAHANKGHFRIIIKSLAFNNKSKVESHRMIYKILEPFMNNGIHALIIHTSV